MPLDDKNLQGRTEKIKDILATTSAGMPVDIQKIQDWNEFGRKLSEALRKSEVSEHDLVKQFKEFLANKVEQERALRGLKREYDPKAWERSWLIEDIFKEICSWWNVDMSKYEARIKSQEDLVKDYL